MSALPETVKFATRLEPGLWRQTRGLERYRVKAGGSVLVELYPGDRLVLQDAEGGQRAEILAIAEDGKLDASALGSKASSSATGLSKILARDTSDARRLVESLKRRNVSLDKLGAIKVFADDSPAGETAHFDCQRRISAVVCAPGEALDFFTPGMMPATDLTAWIERASPPPKAEGLAPPEPLAEPRLDFRVAAMTAEGYEVRKGETIQIIDVQGRECTDFQALDVAALDRGVERPLDMTVTHSMMAAAYPNPGLYSKYFDSDFTPLIEVIRDTVGRHDTFGLACTARSYEDQGYFGHPNCSDNFSAALEAWGIAPRRGWPAINLNYNTRVDDANAIVADESWSRPGDYQLFQALEDLVCVSSACPDDITPTNSWDPTDIHVRVYPAKNKFSKAIAYRMTPDADAALTRETGFHAPIQEKTRNFVEYNGYWLPTHFNNGGAEDEYWACRERVAVMDLSPLRKFEVTGPDAEALMQWTLTRNVRRMAPGHVQYTAMCYEHGGMVDDGTVFRMGDNAFRWIGGNDYGGEWLRKQAVEQNLDRVLVKSSTDQMHNIGVQGPKSRELLKKIVWTPPAQPAVDEIDWFRFTVGRISGFEGIPVVVSRTGFTGELGYEVFCHPDAAPAVWKAVFDAGEEFGVMPLGLDALDMLRIEAGLVMAGTEFCDQTDPFEAGIGFTVALKTKTEDFMGREALVERKAHPQRKLVGLELAGNEPAATGDCVHIGRPQMGSVTSATRSPILAKNIALAKLDVPHTEEGTEVEVGKLDGHQKRIPAKVVKLAFYDPTKSRPRS